MGSGEGLERPLTLLARMTSAGGPMIDSRTGSNTKPFRIPNKVKMASTAKKYLWRKQRGDAHFTQCNHTKFNTCPQKQLDEFFFIVFPFLPPFPLAMSSLSGKLTKLERNSYAPSLAQTLSFAPSGNLHLSPLHWHFLNKCVYISERILHVRNTHLVPKSYLSFL